MNLVWKLLRQHISIPQFVGFFFANLVGVATILLGVQFYNDYKALDSEDSFMKADYHCQQEDWCIFRLNRCPEHLQSNRH